jgi:hypothetical protein
LTYFPFKKCNNKPKDSFGSWGLLMKRRKQGRWQQGWWASNRDEGMATAMAMATATTWAMVTALRLAGDKEGKGKGGKGNGHGNEGGGQQRRQGWQGDDCDGNNEGNGNGNESGGQAMAIVTKRAMVTRMATTVVGDKEGNGNGSKSDGNGNKGGW